MYKRSLNGTISCTCQEREGEREGNKGGGKGATNRRDPQVTCPNLFPPPSPKECVMDLDYQSEMINFESILGTFEARVVF